MNQHSCSNGFVSLFPVITTDMPHLATLQKSLKFLHHLAQKWHKIGTKDFIENHNAMRLFTASSSIWLSIET